MGFLGVYGHVNLDYLLLLKNLPAPETTLPVEQTLVRLGGTGGNIARSATALGVPTSLAACVGDDFPPEHWQTLEKAGIDLTDLKRLPGSTPKVWILSVPNGPQSAIIDQGVMNDGMVRPRLDFAWLNSQWVHFTTGNPQEWLAAAEQARKAGKWIAFDPAQELAYRYTSRQFERFLNLSHLFVCNNVELERALKLLGYGSPQQLFDHTPRILVTRGSQGAQLWTEKETMEIPACPVRNVERVETTGAGDSFRGGLYAGLHRNYDWAEAVRLGCTTASMFLESRGKRFPTWDEAIARFQEWRPNA